MAVMASSRPNTTAGTPGFSATSREGPNVLRKRPSLNVPLPPPLISRRHSWTSSRGLGAMDPNSSRMEVSEISTPMTSHGLPTNEDSLLSNKRAVSTARPGATFDMAYFLRHTGPSTSAATAPVRETTKDDSRRTGRKKSRGGIFRKRRESPDPETPAVPEEQKPAIFVPPEGVEQKVTARGMEHDRFRLLLIQ